jgi:hypothetical protein
MNIYKESDFVIELSNKEIQLFFILPKGADLHP